ncbi:MAG: hypothetical protein RLZZ322_97 [Verrucomicrobiota bacterium]|jgi:hypothetical protein
MKNLIINVSGSSGNIYAVDIKLSEGKMRIYCPCQAGSNNMFCKHIGQILGGDFSSVGNELEKNSLSEVMKSEEAKDTLVNYSALRGALENQLKAEALAKKAASKIKKEIFSLLSGYPDEEASRRG